MSSACRSCGRSIEFAKTEGGKWVPVDPEPVSGGNLALDRSEWPPKATVIKKGEGAQQLTLDGGSVPLGFVSHFATCPDATIWRRN